MWKYRLAWILLFVVSAIMYLFSNGTATLAVLVFSIAAPAVSGLLFFLTRKNLSIRVRHGEPAGETPEPGAAENEGMGIVLELQNRGRLTIPVVEAMAVCRNLRTGTEINVTERCPVPGRRTAELLLSGDLQHAGVYEFSVSKINVYDILHLFRSRKEIPESGRVLVMPSVFPTKITVSGSAAAMLESDKYSQTKGGNDPGEVRNIREYVIGDPVKNIHWKLSEKTDKLLVKELGLPVTDQMLVVLDPTSGEKLPEEALDAMASVYFSILYALENEDLDCTAGWCDPEGGRLVTRKVATESDILEAAEQCLAAPADAESMFVEMKKGSISQRFAHLVIVGSQTYPRLSSVVEGGQVTLILYGYPASSSTGEGVRILGYQSDRYQEELAGLEL